MGVVPVARGLRALRDSAGDLVDEALVLRFASGQSFTGEDVVELHLHGSPAVVAAVLRILGDDPRCGRQRQVNSHAARWPMGGWIWPRSRVWPI